jgi:hypothetical protein
VSASLWFPLQVVEQRLGKYSGSNKQRGATLKQMLSDAGRDDQHLSEQVVKGSKQPNIIYTLPGSSDLPPARSLSRFLGSGLEQPHNPEIAGKFQVIVR